MISLENPAVAGSTSSRAVPTGSTSDHPRVGGDYGNSLAASSDRGALPVHQPLEGVIAA